MKVIAAHSLLATGCGAAPLPFASRLIIFPLQFVMVGQLAHVYDVLLSKKTKIHIVGSVIGISASGTVGCLAANFLKLIPGFNVAGCISDAAISGAVTAAMGFLT